MYSSLGQRLVTSWTSPGTPPRFPVEILPSSSSPSLLQPLDSLFALPPTSIMGHSLILGDSGTRAKEGDLGEDGLWKMSAQDGSGREKILTLHWLHHLSPVLLLGRPSCHPSVPRPLFQHLLSWRVFSVLPAWSVSLLLLIQVCLGSHYNLS